MNSVNETRQEVQAVRRSIVLVSLPSAPAFDLIFENHGSLFLIRPLSPAGQTWLDENVGDAETLTFAGAVVCEPRYVDAVTYGAVQAGLVVSL